MEFEFSSDQKLSKNLQCSDSRYSLVLALSRAGTVREEHGFQPVRLGGPCLRDRAGAVGSPW